MTIDPLSRSARLEDVTLSVIVPTFNARSDVPRLVASMANLPGIEVIFVDDGSTDDTVDILEGLAPDRPGMRLIRLDHRGPGAARNVGLRSAIGRYVAFADADDEIDLAVMLQGCLEAVDLDAEVVIYSYEQGGLGPKVHQPLTVLHPYVRDRPSRVLTDRAAIWGKLYLRSFLLKHQIEFPDVRSADDVFFSWAVAARSPRTFTCSATAYWYYTHPHGQLTSDAKYFLDGITSLGLVLDRSRGCGLRARFLAIYAWSTGSVHILRRLPPSVWRHVLLASVGVFASSFNPVRRDPR